MVLRMIRVEDHQDLLPFGTPPDFVDNLRIGRAPEQEVHFLLDDGQVTGLTRYVVLDVYCDHSSVRINLLEHHRPYSSTSTRASAGLDDKIRPNLADDFLDHPDIVGVL